MSKTTQTPTTQTPSATITIPLNQLRIDDKANVRKTGTGADPEFVASIAARGIMIPLLVRQNGTGYVVVDGGKRLAAAQVLAESGTFTADYPVPCIVSQASDAGAREDSLTLNFIRSQMHPADEYVAFSDLHKNKEQPLDVEAIAKRFGLPRKHVEQVLALGALDKQVLDAYREDKIDDGAAQVFTLCPDKKAQATILNKLLKSGHGERVNAWSVKHALKIGNENPGRLLNVVGIAAYEKRGGKVTRDLFGSDHIVSDAKLLKIMAEEEVEALCKRLRDDGWSWVALRQDVTNTYALGRIDVKPKPTADEGKRLEELQAIIQADETYDDDGGKGEAASDEYDALQAAIAARSYTAAHKAKAGCIVDVTRTGTLVIDYGQVKPESKKPDDDGLVRGKMTAPKKAKAKRKGDDHVSNALVQRLSEQLTYAASAAIVHEPQIAMAALLAGFASEDKTVSVTEKGLKTRRSNTFARMPGFAGVFASMLGKSPAEQAAALAQVAGAALDFQTFNGEHPPLKDKGVAALCDALKPAALNKAIRDTFDAKDYFAAVAKSVIVSAVSEAMGAEHAGRAAKMTKGEAAKFATANMPKTRWLPVQLRTAHYDGPKAKPVATKSKAKTAAKVKAKKTARKGK